MTFHATPRIMVPAASAVKTKEVGPQVEKQVSGPAPVLVVDSFLSDAEVALTWQFVSLMRSRLERGRMRDEAGREVDSSTKKNRNHWLTEPSGKPFLYALPFTTLFKRRLMPVVRSRAVAAEPLFASLRHVANWNVLLSVYDTSDHIYGPHRDASWVTLSFMIHNPKNKAFQGGNFRIAGFGDPDVDRDPWSEIEFRINRLVMFPGMALHETTPLRMSKEDPGDARVTLQWFPQLF